MANFKLHGKVHTYCGSKIPLKKVAAYVRIHYFQQDLTKFDQSVKRKQKKPYAGGEQENEDGTVARALAFHQYGLGSITRLSIIFGLSLSVLYSSLSSFSPGTPGFPISSKTYI